MTTIAYDGRTLAGDKLAVQHDVVSKVTKIHHIPDGMVGFSGQTDRIGVMLEWFRNGRVAADWPEQLNSGDAEALFVALDGSVLVYSSSPYPIVEDQKFYAIGSGVKFALAAMHLGKSAKTAVAVACALSNTSGQGIDTLTLPKKK